MFVMLFGEEWPPAAHGLLIAIIPAGLPLARQLYLYEQIKEYCRDGTEDLVCPNPHLTNHIHSPDLTSVEDINRHAVAPDSKRVHHVGSGVFRGTQREPVRNSGTCIYIFG